MKITTACQQYFDAYNQLKNWRKNDHWTNAGLVIEVTSYATLIIPLLVLATYKAASLIGRISKTKELCNLDKQLSRLFQKNSQNPSKTSSVDKKTPELSQKKVQAPSKISLRELLELDITKQKERLCEIQSTEIKKVIEALGGPVPFLKKLNAADAHMRAHILAASDAAALRYALLSETEIADFPLSALFLPLTDQHVRILHAQLSREKKIDQKELPLLNDLSQLKLAEFNSYAFTIEEMHELIEKFDARIINFFPEERIKDFIINNNKTSDTNESLHHALFAVLQDNNVNKARFSWVSHDRAKKLAESFPRLLSKEQITYFFSTLKVEDLDPHGGCYFAYGEYFHLVPKEEAAKIIKKFRGKHANALSDEQATYCFGNLKAEEMQSWILFAKKPCLFQLVPKEEAEKMIKKFKGTLLDELSEEQAIYFFSNLKAEEVNDDMYRRLFFRVEFLYPTGISWTFIHRPEVSKKRLHLMPRQEAEKLVQKFNNELAHLLSDEQS